MATIKKIKDLMQEMGKDVIYFDTPIVIKLSPHRELAKIRVITSVVGTDFIWYRDSQETWNQITENLMYKEYIVNSIYQQLAIMNYKNKKGNL